jgi:hypothetical protein
VGVLELAQTKQAFAAYPAEAALVLAILYPGFSLGHWSRLLCAYQSSRLAKA